ncbi:MAG: hypothetical protein WA771_08510 [Chthoniobacterales bacterium]
MARPKLRTVEKYQPPYRLNSFPTDFAFNLGREIVYLLATRGRPSLEGADWENIFARIVKADWQPSNVGLDDVVLEQCAWGAKTVKNPRPSKAIKVRLISGRNSPQFSYGESVSVTSDPDELGQKILEIWNERVSSIRKKYMHLRTVVLLKSNDLLEVAAFEFDTEMFLTNQFRWQWNDRGNLEGYESSNSEHKFTWQPHGSQFTIIERVPADRLAIQIRQPPILDQEAILDSLKFDDSWVSRI